MNNDEIKTIDMLIKMKRNIELLQSIFNEINNSKIITDDDYEENTNNLIKMYNAFFNNYFMKTIESDLNMMQNKIINQVKEICNHELEKDYIDTYPECSVPIYYCKKCYLDFPFR